jgi:hypothetical protein
MGQETNDSGKSVEAQLTDLVGVLEQLVQTLNKQIEWFDRQREREDALRAEMRAREDDIRGQSLHREAQIRGESQHREDQIREQMQAREDRLRDMHRADLERAYGLTPKDDVRPAQAQVQAPPRPDPISTDNSASTAAAPANPDT